MEDEDVITLDDIVLWVKSEMEIFYESSRHAARMNVPILTLLVVSLAAAVTWADWRIGVLGVIGVLGALLFLWVTWKSQFMCLKFIGRLRVVWLGILFGRVRTVEEARKLILRSVPGVKEELKVYDRIVPGEKVF